jgi:hypothetical protein
MICTIADVFYEALDSYSGVEMHTDKEHSKFFMGVKIKKDEDGVTIYNTKKGGLFYREIEGVQLDMFLTKGWLSGVYNVAKDNTEETLNTVASAIKTEVGSTKNEKRYEFLKEKRVELMNKISNIIKLIEHENNKHKR